MQLQKNKVIIVIEGGRVREVYGDPDVKVETLDIDKDSEEPAILTKHQPVEPNEKSLQDNTYKSYYRRAASD